jgi:hypothetical protein
MFEQHFAHHQEHFWTAAAASGSRIEAKVNVFLAVVCLLVVFDGYYPILIIFVHVHLLSFWIQRIKPAYDIFSFILTF